MTPNIVSVFMIILGVMGALLVFSEDLWMQLGGITLVYGSFLLDKVDGEIARYKKLFSLRGIYLDEVYHVLVPVTLLTAFLFRLGSEDTTYSFLVLITLLLFVYRRLERKLYIVIATKASKQLERGDMTYGQPKRGAHGLLNSMPFRLASIVERFDIVLLALLLVLVLEHSTELNARLWFLYVYGGLSVLYFVRWTILNAIGSLDEAVKKLNERGY